MILIPITLFFYLAIAFFLFLLKEQLSRSIMPIAYFTGVTCRFWAYITSPMPPVSKFFDGVSQIAMSPIWLAEFLFNQVTGPYF